MDFFKHQERARRKTARLVAYYAAGVFLTLLSVHLLVAAQAALFFENEYEGGSEEAVEKFSSDPVFLLTDFLIGGLVIAGGSLYKTAQMKRSDGDGVARAYGGRRITAESRPLKEKRLLNIVEETALAAGIPAPHVYLLSRERSINAFAAGWTVPTSVIGVTAGALRYLTRDELQGVIAHEMSHILNRDTRLNMRLIGILFGLEMIAKSGYALMSRVLPGSGGEFKTRGRKIVFGPLLLLSRIGIFFPFGLFLFGTGLFGLLFANMIRAAALRQREFLADAAAVQYTRNPDGIAGALIKLGSRAGARIDEPRALEAAHLFFGCVFREGLFRPVFRTHPSLTERIRRIDPAFDGKFPETPIPAGATERTP